MPAGEPTIEVVRGRLSEDRAEQILRFWSDHASLDAEEARRRLPEVVCVALDPAGDLAAVNSAYPEEVPLIGGRRFWIYRSLVAKDSDELSSGMFNTAFDGLQSEFDLSQPGDFDASQSGPVGLCVPVSDRAEMERRPQAMWP